MAWILYLKVVAVSAAVVFTALGVKASVPLAITYLSPLWNMCLLCFKPPFLYLLLNAIIITIVASSRCFHHSFDSTTPPPAPVLHVNPVLLKASVSTTLQDQEEPEQEDEEEEEEEEEKAIDVGVVVDSVEESSLVSLQSIGSTEFPPEYPLPAEKPLVAARFAHRKPPKSTPEGGRALRVVARPKRHETLENTWKAITEGRAMPLSRHVRKCDTWQSRGSAGGPQPQEVRKWETFKEGRANQPLTPVSVSGGRLRKEPSLSQDELNRRVEAFIRQFNEQMRLQRQESLNQYVHADD